MTEQQRKPRSADPTPELPDEGADLEPQAQPLAHDEPIEAHTAAPVGSGERALAGDVRTGADRPLDDHAMGSRPGEHVDEHDTSHGHEHEEARVGPIDWPAWGYAVVGVAVALVVVYAFWVAAY